MTWEEAVKSLREQIGMQDLVRHCYYDDPLIDAAERYYNSDEWEAVKQIIFKFIPGKVLDIGAGRGISSYAFVKEGCEVTALEPDSSTVVGAGAIKSLFEFSGHPIDIVQTYCETLPFNDSYFDIVYGRAVLHHAFNIQKFCTEAARVLKPGGVFIVTREHVITRIEDLQQFLDSHPLHNLYGGENAFMLEKYYSSIVSAGLKNIQVLGPLDSPINYSPMSYKEVQKILSSYVARFIGDRFADFFVTNKTLRQICLNILTNKMSTPGRLYSFVAVKL